MARIILENNEATLGKDVVEKAKKKVSKERKTKEGNVDEQEKDRRTRKPRKSA